MARSDITQDAACRVEHLHAVLRPYPNGKWFIQKDVDHMPTGILTKVKQTDEYVRIFFHKKYKFVGAIQISGDDGFLNRVSGHASLGLNNASIKLAVDGKVINPSDITKIDPEFSNNGNFWISAQMVECAP